MSHGDSEPPEKSLFQIQKISAGEISKNNAKGFSGGASGRVRPQALGLSFSHFARNRFEFQRTREPNATAEFKTNVLYSAIAYV